MNKLTKREECVLSYLKSVYESSKDMDERYVSPTYVSAILGVEGYPPSGGDNVCKALLKKGKLERNEKGHYRYIKNENI